MRPALYRNQEKESKTGTSSHDRKEQVIIFKGIAVVGLHRLIKANPENPIFSDAIREFYDWI